MIGGEIDCSYWLQRYLESTRPKLLLEVGGEALFLSGCGERFNPSYLGNWVAKRG